MHQRILFAPDGLTVAAAINPKIVNRKEEHYMSVELSGKNTRGMTYVDWLDQSGKEANAEIILEINQPLFVEMFETGLS
jgi:inosine-uridine nucleoside N-ribohydrolase